MMTKIYFNHKAIEDNPETSKVLRELVILTKYLRDEDFDTYFYQNIWKSTLKNLNINLSKYILHNETDSNLKLALWTFINNGPHFPIENSCLQLNENSYQEDFLNICNSDNQNKILSLKSEQTLTEATYNINDFKITNIIGKENLINFLDNQLIFNSIEDIFNKIESTYSNKIIIHQKAKNSAKQKQFDFKTLYKVLKGCVEIILKDSLDGKETKEIYDNFYKKYAFHISKESKQTSNDSSLRELRTIQKKNGVSIYCDEHIKMNDLRIHYYVDKEESKIYIGHCGKKLSTTKYKV